MPCRLGYLLIYPTKTPQTPRAVEGPPLLQDINAHPTLLRARRVSSLIHTHDGTRSKRHRVAKTRHQHHWRKRRRLSNYSQESSKSKVCRLSARDEMVKGPQIKPQAQLSCRWAAWQSRPCSAAPPAPSPPSRWPSSLRQPSPSPCWPPPASSDKPCRPAPRWCSWI